MAEPPGMTDQQQRDAHLVRQTAALEVIAAKTSSIQTYVAWAFWVSVVVGGLAFIIALTEAARL